MLSSSLTRKPTSTATLPTSTPAPTSYLENLNATTIVELSRLVENSYPYVRDAVIGLQRPYHKKHRIIAVGFDFRIELADLS